MHNPLPSFPTIAGDWRSKTSHPHSLQGFDSLAGSHGIYSYGDGRRCPSRGIPQPSNRQDHAIGPSPTSTPYPPLPREGRSAHARPSTRAHHPRLMGGGASLQPHPRHQPPQDRPRTHQGLGALPRLLLGCTFSLAGVAHAVLRVPILRRDRVPGCIRALGHRLPRLLGSRCVRSRHRETRKMTPEWYLAVAAVLLSLLFLWAVLHINNLRHRHG